MSVSLLLVAVFRLTLGTTPRQVVRTTVQKTTVANSSLSSVKKKNNNSFVKTLQGSLINHVAVVRYELDLCSYCSVFICSNTQRRVF